MGESMKVALVVGMKEMIGIQLKVKVSNKERRTL